MSYLLKEEERDYEPGCLQCGSAIYGRPDKQFCSQSCKDRWHYVKKAARDRYRRRILIGISRNYELLEDLLERGITSIDRTDFEEQGFGINWMTGLRKQKDKRVEYRCFDIGYKISDTRIYGIGRTDLGGV